MGRTHLESKWEGALGVGRLKQPTPPHMWGISSSRLPKGPDTKPGSSPKCNAGRAASHIGRTHLTRSRHKPKKTQSLLAKSGLPIGRPIPQEPQQYKPNPPSTYPAHAILLVLVLVLRWQRRLLQAATEP